MGVYDEQLLELQQKAKRAAQIREQLEAMKHQRRSLSYEVSRTAEKQQREQEDVNYLSSGLSGFFSKLSGGHRERMEKEVEECLEAAMEHDAADKALRELKEQMAEYETALQELLPYEEAYHTRMQTLYESMKASGTPEGTELLVLEAGLAKNQQQQKDVRWALQECDAILQESRNTGQELNSARSEYAQMQALRTLSYGRNKSYVHRTTYEKLHPWSESAHTITLGLQVRLNHFCKLLEEKDLDLPQRIDVNEHNLGELRLHLSKLQDALQAKLKALSEEEQQLRDRTNARLEAALHTE